ncbi:MAG TPA: transposase [Rhodanobacteraceae bacterium]|nr:transposase [Rhodanobacteraceae bacterium]
MDDLIRLNHPGHAALRRGRRSMPGQPVLVTTVSHDRQPWFKPWPVAAAVARELGGNRLWRNHHVHAWVLMPDHMHVLLSLEDDESLSQLMRRVKAVSARAVHAITRSSQPVWSRAFHDHALRSDEAVMDAARYVIGNPVRAGLVDSIWKWSCWDCEWLPEVGDEGLDSVRGTGRGFRRSYEKRKRR